MSALCTAPSRPVRNPTTRGESCGCVDESFAPARALRAVWTSPWTTRTRCPPPCPHSRPQAPQDQPPVILTGQHRSTLRRGCLHRLFKTTSAPHSNRSQHRPRAGSPPILQAHFRMGLDSCQVAFDSSAALFYWFGTSRPRRDRAILQCGNRLLRRTFAIVIKYEAQLPVAGSRSQGLGLLQDDVSKWFDRPFAPFNDPPTAIGQYVRVGAEDRA